MEHEHPKENPAMAGGAPKQRRVDNPDYLPNRDENLVLSAALAYAERGIPTFPCRNCPGDERHKTPHTSRGFYDASTDPDTIRRWWRRWPNAFLAMPTGDSSGVAVLDLDCKTNRQGVHKNGFLHVPDWAKLTPVISRTGSGGAHLYFRSDCSIYNTTDQIALGVDSRGQGGYAICPPSEGYSWIKGTLLQGNVLDLPPWPRGLRPRERPLGVPGDKPEADPRLVAAAVAVIPNPDLDWTEWSKIGMAIFRSTDGQGFDIFDAWSRKSAKYDARETRKRWNGFQRSPPTRIGVGTLIYYANAFAPGWANAYDAALEASVMGAAT
jgi:hypothetical protein